MRLLKSFGYALNGLRAAMRTERNIRIHLGAAAMVIALAWWLGLSAGDWCIILLAVGVVLSAELFNTALETLADVVTEETHPGIGRVKDVAAAAVLIVCVISVIVGVIVFAKYV